MNDIMVAAAAIAAIGLVNWYFFFSHGTAAAAAAGVGGIQEQTITVQGGYEPAAVRVRSGAPVRLTFDRRETSGCSEEVVFPDFGVKKFLPAFEKTTIELPAQAPGTYEFTCGMSMLRGRLIVEEVQDA